MMDGSKVSMNAPDGGEQKNPQFQIINFGRKQTCRAGVLRLVLELERPRSWSAAIRISGCLHRGTES